jgi:hypothetical protein
MSLELLSYLCTMDPCRVQHRRKPVRPRGRIVIRIHHYAKLASSDLIDYRGRLALARAAELFGRPS